MELKTFFAVLLAIASVNAVVISQVLYYPLGTDSGGEAIELVNEHSSPVDISGWWIKTERSDKDAVVPQGVLLQPNSKYLVADKNWSALRDNLDWKLADFEEAVTMYNTDSGIVLFDSAGVQQDIVCWGNSSLCQYPGKNVKKGNALVRVNYTGKVSSDFAESSPYFYGDNVIILVAEISGNAPIIVTDDDVVKEGIQVMPVAGGMKNVIVEANYLFNVTFGSKKVACVMVNSTCTAIISMNYSSLPGNYTLSAAGYDLSFDYLGISAMKVSSGKVYFRTGPNSEKVSDQNAVVENLGNIPANISINANNLAGVSGAIDKSAVFVSVDSGSFVDLSQEIKAVVAVGKSSILSFKLAVPDVAMGTYTGAVVVE